MDDVLESGSWAPEEDEAGCLFCVYVKSGLLVLRHDNNPGRGDLRGHLGHGQWHGRDRPPKPCWKASAMWWLAKCGRAAMGAKGLIGIDCKDACPRQRGCRICLHSFSTCNANLKLIGSACCVLSLVLFLPLLARCWSTSSSESTAQSTSTLQQLLGPFSVFVFSKADGAASAGALGRWEMPLLWPRPDGHGMQLREG